MFLFWPVLFVKASHPRRVYRANLRVANILLGMALIFTLVSGLGWILKVIIAVWKMTFVFISRYYLKKESVPRPALAWMLLGSLLTGILVLSGAGFSASAQILYYLGSLAITGGIYRMILKSSPS